MTAHSSDDAAVVESFDPARYPLTDLNAAVNRARDDYEALATKVNASADSTSVISKRVEEQFTKQFRTSARAHVRKVRGTWLDAFVKAPGLATALLPELKELVSFVREWSDMEISGKARNERDAQEIPEDLVEVATELREFVRKLYEMCNMMGIETTVPTTTRKVKGGAESTGPDLTRLAGDRSNVGRGAKRSKYRFTIDGVEHVDMYPREAIMVYAGSWNAFLDFLKSKEIEFSGEPFQVKWNGKTISAEIPDNATTEESTRGEDS